MRNLGAGLATPFTQYVLRPENLWQQGFARMPKRRLNWHYDDDTQEFLTPSGRRVSLHEIADMLHDRASAGSTLKAPGLAGASEVPR